MRLQPMGTMGRECGAPLGWHPCARDINRAVAHVDGRFVHHQPLLLYFFTCLVLWAISRLHRSVHLTTYNTLATSNPPQSGLDTHHTICRSNSGPHLGHLVRLGQPSALVSSSPSVVSSSDMIPVPSVAFSPCHTGSRSSPLVTSTRTETLPSHPLKALRSSLSL